VPCNKKKTEMMSFYANLFPVRWRHVNTCCHTNTFVIGFMPQWVNEGRTRACSVWAHSLFPMHFMHACLPYVWRGDLRWKWARNMQSRPLEGMCGIFPEHGLRP
jgi:hypothetical protein